jgi:hypothetical protein
LLDHADRIDLQATELYREIDDPFGIGGQLGPGESLLGYC